MSGHPQGGYHDDSYAHQQGGDAYYQDGNQAYYDNNQEYPQQHGGDAYYDEAYVRCGLCG